MIKLSSVRIIEADSTSITAEIEGVPFESEHALATIAVNADVSVREPAEGIIRKRMLATAPGDDLLKFVQRYASPSVAAQAQADVNAARSQAAASMTGVKNLLV